MNTTMEDIIASNRIKKETWENCRKDLQGILTSEQLEKLEDVFTLLQKDIFSEGRSIRLWMQTILY